MLYALLFFYESVLVGLFLKCGFYVVDKDQVARHDSRRLWITDLPYLLQK